MSRECRLQEPDWIVALSRKVLQSFEIAGPPAEFRKIGAGEKAGVAIEQELLEHFYRLGRAIEPQQQPHQRLRRKRIYGFFAKVSDRGIHVLSQQRSKIDRVIAAVIVKRRWRGGAKRRRQAASVIRQLDG